MLARFFIPRTLTMVSLLLALLLAAPLAAATQKEFNRGKIQGGTTKYFPPPFSRINKLVHDYFTKLDGFDEKGIITASQVEPLFPLIERAGWKIPRDQREAILAKVLPDDDFMAKQLGTAAGKKFAAQIHKYPDGFDRLDRLSRMPQGQDTVSRLIVGPDGYKMIQYMTTAQGGKNMGRMLSDSPKGGRFNKPTGRIYTVNMLLLELKGLYYEAFVTVNPPAKNAKNK